MAGVPHLVDPPTWQRAGWVAMAFLVPSGQPVGLGFVFNGDLEAAAAIFEGWRGAVGARDEYGILRGSIVEGDRGGRGYFVHASVDLVVATERAIETGEVIDLDMRALSGDVARWFPQRDPAPLETFKNRYRNEGQCQLVPVLLSDGGIDPRYELGVLSSAVKLRTLAEVTDPKDPDYPLVKNA
jgi:hypothetical protein